METIIVRSPYSTRPYQHVLEQIAVYLMIAKAQYEDATLAGSYNAGPDDVDCYTTEELVSLFCEEWDKATGDSINWSNQYDGGPHEANYLKLDCSKLKTTFEWRSRWNVKIAMQKIIEWSKIYLENGNIIECMDNQIMKFF